MDRPRAALIATGLARASLADPALAAHAVGQAMEQLSVSHASGVLLFLSSHFSRNAAAALLAACRQSQCLQVAGGCASGVFTEQDWIFDAPAAAAMVFSAPLQLMQAHSPEPDDVLLSLRASQAAARGIGEVPGLRFGGVLGSGTVMTAGCVWQHGKIRSEGDCDVYLPGHRAATGISHGIRPLTHPLEITGCSAFELTGLGHEPALDSLARELPLEIRQLDRLPLHRILAAEIFGPVANAMEEGRYRLIPLVATDPQSGSVTLADPPSRGGRLFWAFRQTAAAEHSMRIALQRSGQSLGSRPDFAIMASSSARGAALYGDDDRDLKLLTLAWPGMPVIGFYGNGEFASMAGQTHLLEYACSFGLFSLDV